jgi:hypothetical protein
MDGALWSVTFHGDPSIYNNSPGLSLCDLSYKRTHISHSDPPQQPAPQQPTTAIRDTLLTLWCLLSSFLSLLGIGGSVHIHL